VITKPPGSTGRYFVVFRGLSAWLGSRSTLHVTSETGRGYGVRDDVHCKPVTPYLVSDKVEVRCFRTSTGAPSNGAFRVLVNRPFYDLAFAYAHLPTSTNYAPSAPGSWNPAGASRVVRTAVGRYEVVFDSIGSQLPEVNGVLIGGHVQVNAVGTDNAHCKFENQYAQSTLRILVRCFTSAGQPVDSKFSVLFLTPADHLAYAMAHLPTQDSYSPLPYFSTNPSGNVITITRTGVGVWRVRWALADPRIYGYGNIQVTAWGSDNTQCRANSLVGFTNEHAEVVCFGPDGLRKDVRFNVMLAS
jgi:hypothetical protein